MEYHSAVAVVTHYRMAFDTQPISISAETAKDSELDLDSDNLDLSFTSATYLLSKYNFPSFRYLVYKMASIIICPTYLNRIVKSLISSNYL